MKAIIVGAGVIGALSAYRLAQAGVAVTILDAAGPASGASGASFGWINASFHENPHHFAFRVAGMEAYRALERDLKTQAISWPGCLCWEETGDAFDRQYAALTALGYTPEILDKKSILAKEPKLPAPSHALYFEREGVADLAALTRDALLAAQSMGARLITGVPIRGLTEHGGQITGVLTDHGAMVADRVVVASGAGAPAILAGVGVTLPMLARPGLILKSKSIPPLIRHVLVAPGQELRQLETGAILAPTAASHQSDMATEITQLPDELSDAACERISTLLGTRIEWAETSSALRPVPGDGLPVLGPAGPDGLYVAVMHSGATLGALAGQIVADMVVGRGVDAALLAPYAADRFSSK